MCSEHVTILCFYSNISSDQMLYSEKDLEKSMDKIETVNFHQVRGPGGEMWLAQNLTSTAFYLASEILLVVDNAKSGIWHICVCMVHINACVGDIFLLKTRLFRLDPHFLLILRHEESLT